MKKLEHVAMVATILLGVAIASPASAEWRTNYEAAREAIKNKDFRSAEDAAIAALNEAEAFGQSDERRLDTLELLSDVYRETRQWAASAALLEQTIAAMTKAGTEGSPSAGYLYNKLGVVYQQMRENDKAEVAYQASLAIKRKKYADNVASIAVVVSNLGELYRRKKDWARAEELHKQAISDKEMELGPDHPTLVPSLNNLALVYKETKRFDEALALLKRAEAIALKGENGGRNADRATALHNMGDVYAAQAKYKESKQSYEQAIAMRRDVLGPQHPNLGESLNNYGAMLMGMNLPAEALKAYDEAIEIRKFEFGSSDTRTTATMTNKAMALDRLKRSEEATKLRDEVKALELRRLRGE